MLIGLFGLLEAHKIGERNERRGNYYCCLVMAIAQLQKHSSTQIKRNIKATNGSALQLSNSVVIDTSTFKLTNKILQNEKLQF